MAEYVLTEVLAERRRQDAKWGQQNHPDGSGRECDKVSAVNAREACDQAFREDWPGTWAHILREEVAEALAESDPASLRTELIQVAAVAAAWVEAIDRRVPRRCGRGPCAAEDGHEGTCDEASGWTVECSHDWTLRPESDTWVCEMCGAER